MTGYEIIAELKHLGSDEYWNDPTADEERRHIRADDLLCETIKQAAQGGIGIDEADEICELFNSFTKWYS